MKVKVLKALKPKVVALGFSDEELRDVSDNIAAGLTEEATEEEINAAVDAALPILKVSQKAVTRIVNATKKKPDENKNEGGDKKPEENPGAEGNSKDLEALLNAVNSMKSALDPLREDIAALKAEKSQTKYFEIVKERCKHMDADFFDVAVDGRSFESDEQVETFISNLDTRWKAYSQKLANEGLSRLSKPAGGQDSKPDPTKPSEEVAVRIKKREAEKVAPAIKGLPE